MGAYRNEQIWHQSLVLKPRLAVLVAASLNVTHRAVGNHSGEKDRVEPREGATETGNETPVQGKVKIAGVVDLASLAICGMVSNLLYSTCDVSKPGLRTPTVNQDRRTISGLESLGVLQGLPRELRESVTEDHSSSLLLAETVLLAVCRVPDPVDKEVREVQEHQDNPVPAVFGWVVVSQIDGAVAVGQRDTGKVPENEHKSPLLVIHVPIMG